MIGSNAARHKRPLTAKTFPDLFHKNPKPAISPARRAFYRCAQNKSCTTPLALKSSRLRSRDVIPPRCSGVTSCNDGYFSASSPCAANLCSVPSRLANAATCFTARGIRAHPAQMALAVIPSQEPFSTVSLTEPTTPCYLTATYAELVTEAAKLRADAMLMLRPSSLCIIWTRPAPSRGTLQVDSARR